MLNHHTEGLHKNQIGPPEVSFLDNVEFADNPEARCPVVLIVDTSSSMTGEPIARVNEAIADFRTEISKDHLVFLRADVSLVAFNHETQGVRLRVGEAVQSPTPGGQRRHPHVLGHTHCPRSPGAQETGIPERGHLLLPAYSDAPD